MRREVAMVFRSFYQEMEAGGRQPRGSAVESELIMCMCLMPLMVTDFRLRISPMVTASDASSKGFAVLAARPPRGRTFRSIRSYMLRVYGSFGARHRAYCRDRGR